MAGFRRYGDFRRWRSCRGGLGAFSAGDRGCDEVGRSIARGRIGVARRRWNDTATIVTDSATAIAPKSLERFKQRIRDVTRRAKGVSIKTTMEELAQYMRGVMSGVRRETGKE